MEGENGIRFIGYSEAAAVILIQYAHEFQTTTIKGDLGTRFARLGSLESRAPRKRGGYA